MSIYERLRDYFQDQANTLADEKAASKVFPNAADAGAAREGILAAFLTRHLPTRCELIRGGFIFDFLGSESRQIDLIVTNDLTLQFKLPAESGQQDKSFNCVEGCYCAISVKTNLNKAGLIDSLAGFASIPPMPDPGNRLNPMITNRHLFLDLPFKVVFAFEGIDPETLHAHMNEFYAGSPTPQNRRPDLIIVNNRYVMARAGRAGAVSRNGTRVPPLDYRLTDVKVWKYVGAWSLMYLLVKIQEAACVGPHFFFSFAGFLDNLPV
jgi:hypothetical protein